MEKPLVTGGRAGASCWRVVIGACLPGRRAGHLEGSKNGANLTFFAGPCAGVRQRSCQADICQACACVTQQAM